MAEEPENYEGNVPRTFNSEEMPEQPLLAPGHRLGDEGRYTIQVVVGQGCTGIVYRAWDEQSQRHVAVTTLRKDAFRSTYETARVLKEVWTVGKLKHAAIASLYSYGRQADDMPFIVGEYVDGASLRALLDKSGLDRGWELKLMSTVVDALRFVHAAGFVHGGVKPSSILVKPDGSPLLRGLGLSVLRDMRRLFAQDLTDSFRYMAPEQVGGGTHLLTPATDVWAVGTVLYEILTGIAPFNGNTREDLVEEILRGDPKHPSAIDATIHKHLEDTCLMCLRKQASERCTTSDLALCLGGFTADSIDWFAVARACGGDPELLRTLAEATCERLQEFVPEMRRGLAEGSFELLALNAHGIKGACRYFMGPAEEAFELAACLEFAAKSGDMEGCVRLLERLEPAARQVVAAIQKSGGELAHVCQVLRERAAKTENA